eukprot:6212929-Pleurochrysis_carterae.AAC.3
MIRLGAGERLASRSAELFPHLMTDSAVPLKRCSYGSVRFLESCCTLRLAPGGISFRAHVRCGS